MAEVSRRTVLGAGAWSVPVVVVAVAAPTAAASATAVPMMTTLHFQGERTIRVDVVVSNPTTSSLVVTVTRVVSPPDSTAFVGAGGEWVFVSDGVFQITLAPGASSAGSSLGCFLGVPLSSPTDQPYFLTVYANAPGQQQAETQHTGTL